MQRDVGPSALFRLLRGALGLDAETFRAAALPGRTRLHLAIVVLAAISGGFSTAMEAASAGLLEEREVGLYRVLVIGWSVAVVVQFLLFVAAAWGLRWLTRRPPVSLVALGRLLALSLAPACLVVLGPLLGYPAAVTAIVTVWRWAIAVVGLRVGVDASWLGALLTILAADRISAALADLIMLGVR